jgi:hypothetical protein
VANAAYPWLTHRDLLATFDLRGTGYGRIATTVLGAVLGSLVALPRLARVPSASLC